MRIIKDTTRHVIFGGIVFILPLMVMFILIREILGILEPISARIEPIFGDHEFLGVTTVTAIGIVLLLIICYIAGLLLKKGFISFWGPRMEVAIFRLFPSLQMMKFIVLPENELESFPWKAFILGESADNRIGFITDESNENYYSLFIPDAPRMDAGEVRVIKREDFDGKPISLKDAFTVIHNFGKGLKL